MPQGGRKVAFSGKKKKAQLLKKRERKRNESEIGAVDAPAKDVASASVEQKISERTSSVVTEISALNEQPRRELTQRVNRFRMCFKKESEEEIQKRKEEARTPFKLLPEEVLEVSFEDIYDKDCKIDIPKRPAWDFIISKYELEAKEQSYFREYLEEIEFKYKERNISYFEMNLETWRQLWRVLEMSDIILIVADIRNPIIHFPPGLYKYATEELNKDVILVLNKIDLVDASVVIAWTHYLKSLFPKLYIMCFASYAGASNTIGKRGRRKGKLHMAIDGAKELLGICEQIVQNSVDLSSWHQKIKDEEQNLESKSDSDKDDNLAIDSSTKNEYTASISSSESGKYKDGILTIGCVGHPNVGKSSLLNAIVGKKVLSGLCPVAQLREPYTSVKYLAERLSIPRILKLKHPEEEGIAACAVNWSAYDICEAWAEKRGFLTSRAARLDTYRAANNLLRMALDGRTLCLAFYPPNYCQQKSTWLIHSDIGKIMKIQGEKKLESTLDDPGNVDGETDYSSSDEDKVAPSMEEKCGSGNSEEKLKNRFALLLS
ncbi:guanine nucleotide-binding protein-like 1 isoform X2 [Centruroides sculpturatus]|uniref:guanine nucleotide-binding protein-like 1 isoform X2 n=1 Tax=Centruroides sculpturatus TaxID=218467 RepID=UPI000C6CD7B9|nr:guanine nucleotide-binding protein-like 1 isoform X2 [Centruroides sculpturatus]